MSGTNGGAHESWELVTRVFEKALEVPPGERQRFVANQCEGRPDVIGEIEGLLKAHDESGEFLNEMDSVRALSLLDDDEEEPTFAGPFRLVREIGRGGMGAVYLGERSDGQFDRQVAIKIIKRGMDSDAIKSRFLRERQILAGLEHSHIGRLYDGGVTEDGQPYFAMEYVDGLPLTAYCDKYRLTIDKRLQLFEQACGAVQYAHQNLVVHRDLKPSNMLVTGDGTLKLLDFGIAKVLSDGEDAGALTTLGDGHRVLTPEYASPEQLLGETITTTSDVYSLGVVLYELLAGHRPYSVDSREPARIEKSISDSRVPAPSTVLAYETAGHDAGAAKRAEPSDIAAARSTTAPKLQRRLRGDLDTIVLKALRKDPKRRYVSVEAMAEDLRRHTNGLPILARPESVSYRTGKFVERHRIGVSIAAVVAILLLSAVAVSLNLAQEKSRESVKARQVTEFLASMFASSDPDQTQGAEITVRELLEEGSERIETELAGQPEVQADLLEVMGQVYMKLGLYEKSEALHRSALANRRGVLGDRHPLVARSMHRTAVTLRAQARWAEAESMLEEAASMQRELLGPDSEDLANTLYDVAWIESYQKGNYEVAERLNRQAVAIFEKRVGRETEQVARGLYNIGWLLQRQGRYEGAAEHYRQSLALWTRLAGDHHRSVAKNLSGLANVTQDLGDFDEAERLHRQALEIRRKVLAPDHPDVATSLNNLAGTLRDKGDFATAAEYFGQACDIYRGRLGPEHPYTSVCEQNLGAAMAGSGRVEEGIRLLERVLETRVQQLGIDHPEIAVTHVRLGEALMLKGAHEAAANQFRRALAVRTEQLGADHPETAAVQVQLALALREQGMDEEATSLIRTALATQELALGADNPVTEQTKALVSPAH